MLKNVRTEINPIHVAIEPDERTMNSVKRSMENLRSQGKSKDEEESPTKKSQNSPKKTGCLSGLSGGQGLMLSWQTQEATGVAANVCRTQE